VSARVVLVGGGLANGTIALRLAASRPDIDLVMLERERTLGGNHLWSFHDGDLTPEQHEWIGPLVARSWLNHEIRFPELQRRMEGRYHSVTSARLHRVVAGILGDRLINGAEVREVRPHEVRLADGTVIQGDVVIDGRGNPGGSAFMVAYQKFLGRLLVLENEHGLGAPILMDADVKQRDGFRFIYSLPFSGRTIFVEDTRYSDTPDLDREELRSEIERYARTQGWHVLGHEREEVGVLPIVLGGDIEMFWEAGTPGVPRSGMRAALFHPTTGYSLPEAVRLADAICERSQLRSEELYPWIRERSRKLWRQGRFFRLLNRMLFRAAEPARRYVILQRFYRLPEPLIVRFYAGRPTPGDRLRILTGKPPVPLLRALKCLWNDRQRPADANAS
jgi:lycopene beta-cyclase